MTFQHTTDHQVSSGLNTGSTRWLVLKALRSLGKATINELADVVGVAGVTVRHHLTNLQAEGLIDVEAERRSVGRPVHIYRLSHEAERFFPHAYHLLVDGLLDQVKDQLPADAIDQLIDGLANSLTSDLRKALAGQPEAVQRQILLDWLDEQGMTARWQDGDDGPQLVRYHCPYYDIGARHPEICRIELSVVGSVLGTGAKRLSCMQHGDSACTLVVSQEGNSTGEGTHA
ncbi:MAG: ArsR family transcriptional regulator [Anaerolineae bacterium]|nr:ArsR family transcriptional regulator [Anaerolineae bacterium]